MPKKKNGTSEDNLLLPDRHPQVDLFICDINDAVLKDDLGSMEHPVFSLSKKPETKPVMYRNKDKYVEIIPSGKGRATIWDKDILIYVISQMIAAGNKGAPLSRNVKIKAHDLLVFINRSTGGKDYEALKDALDRLDGTRIRTNVITGGTEEYSGFGLIDSFSIKRSEKNGRIIEMTMTISDWLYRSITTKEVLTLNKEYFRLGKSIHRRVYEIARKHCGKQSHWKLSLEALQNKCGSSGTLAKFRFAIKEITERNHLPDYIVTMENDFVHFHLRSAMPTSSLPGISESAADLDYKLSDEIMEEVRSIAPGMDVENLCSDWYNWWVDSGKVELSDPDKAFLNFCKRQYDKVRSQ